MIDRSVRCPIHAPIAKALRRCRDSAPGPDGIPSAGWRDAGKEGSKTLGDVQVDTLMCGVPDFSFNQQRMAFLAKGFVDMDVQEVIRVAAQTRGLGLKNDDSKINAAAVNDVIAGQLAEKLHFSQRGSTR